VLLWVVDMRNKNSRKFKGLSPLIGAIILIAFVMAVGAIAATFFTGFSETSKIQIEQKKSGSISCTVAALKIDKDSIRFDYPQIDGLVSYWSFDEGSGSIVHDYEGNNDGQINGDPSWVNGKYGYALNFDGVDDYVDVSTNLNPSLSSITINAWIKGSGTGDEVFFSIISGADTSNYVLFRKNSLLEDFKLSVGGVSSGINFITDLRDGTFNMITATYNASNGEWKVYINGNLDNSQTNNIGSLSLSSEPVSIGRDSRDKNYFNGTVDEVFIYNKSLSEEEIQNLMNKKIFLDIENIGQTDLSGLKIIAYNETGAYTYDVSPSSISEGSKLTITSDAPDGTITKIKIISTDCPGVESVVEKENGEWKLKR